MFAQGCQGTRGAFIAATPQGTRDRLFSEAEEIASLERDFAKLYKSRGYSEVMTPSVEYYDTWMRSGSTPELLQKLIDRDGRVLVLRPDSTTPIARVAATKLKNLPMPQRLFYRQTVYRSDGVHAGRNSEIPQAGIELLGADGLKADLEAVYLAAESLKMCGMKDFLIEIGHAGFFRRLLAELGADVELSEEIRLLIESKNFAALNDAVEPFGDVPAARAILRLPYLFGGAEVLEEAAALNSSEEALGAIGRLSEIFEFLSRAGLSEYLRLDLGLVRRLDYYTSVVFRGYARGAGSEVLSGGRYNSLASAFGLQLPAIGFAINLDVLASCLDPERAAAPEFMVHFEPDAIREAIAFTDSNSGARCELSLCGTVEDTLALAKSKGIKRVAVIKGGEAEIQEAGL